MFAKIVLRKIMQLYYLILMIFNRPVSVQKLSKYFNDEDIEFFEFLGWVKDNKYGENKWDAKETKKA
jgi:hypothetical protein